jgi:hypothetical protein
LHTLPFAAAALNTHPLDGLQLSAVHGFWSLHVIALPPQVPAEQWSFCVHALPSSHTLPFAAAALKTHPLDGLHESAVHGFWSLHVIALPPQVPALHVSFWVHALPSSHALPFAAAAWNTHPRIG